MKIERLYTLSQFIDIMETGMRYNLETKGEDYETIVQYNNFLKQPLKKEMFVNEVRQPKTYDEKYNKLGEHYGDIFSIDYTRWQEAEKKVIFFGNTFPISNCKTLHDLAEATNGELKLKNVEL